MPSQRQRAQLSPAARQSAASEGVANVEGGLRVPEWVKDAVFYQIFPDRFANGDIGNDPNGTSPWGTKPTVDTVMGGDLNGITQKFGYLTSLGVNALYLNPVHPSPSNHRYDVTDYDDVDPRLGGQAAFKQMVDSAHRNGVKVMLDGVFNHTSHQHKWFRDVREKGPKSEYFDRYDVRQWPIRYRRDEEGVLRSGDYDSWWDYASLPELKTDHPKVREYFLNGPNAVVKKWIKEGKIDGWRMDVADEVEADFWREARKEIKSANPDTYMVSENWHDASPQLQGDQFDGAMNYKYFQQPAIKFFAKKEISSDDFVRQLENPYSPEARMGMFNLLGSHDTPRFVTEAGGDWYRMRPAAIFQMTYVGAPVVYYGDELGMEGGKDPDTRRAFPWDKVPGTGQRPLDRPGTGPAEARTGVAASVPSAPGDARNGAKATGASEQLYDLYRTLIATRKQEPALRRGDFQVLSTHNANRTVAYRRHIPGEARDAVVALNSDVTGHPVTVPMSGIANDGTTYVDKLTGTSYRVTDGKLELPHVEGNHGAVLLRELKH